MQSGCSVLQRLWLPLLTTLIVSFAVKFNRSARVPGHAETQYKCKIIHQTIQTTRLSFTNSERKYFEKPSIHAKYKRYHSLPVEVIQAGLDVGIVIVHLVLVEGRFRVQCCQCLLELHELGLPPLPVASLVANVLPNTGLLYKFGS